MNELTDKQRRFCEEYVIDWNATRAATAAGYSEKTAAVIGGENLRKPYIQEYIEGIQKDLAKLAGVSALGNLIELRKIAFEIDANGKPRRVPKNKAMDRLRAIEIINKMLGYNAPEKSIQEHANPVQINVKLNAEDIESDPIQ